jgi:hypothetical protein
MPNPSRCFNGSPEVIRVTVMMCVRYPLSLRQVEDLLFEGGIDICHESPRLFASPLGRDPDRKSLHSRAALRQCGDPRVWSGFSMHIHRVSCGL